MGSPHRDFWGTPSDWAVFGQVGVGAGGLGTFGGKLFGTFTFSKKYHQIWGVANSGRVFDQPSTGQILGPIKTNTPRVVSYLKRVPKWT